MGSLLSLRGRYGLVRGGVTQAQGLHNLAGGVGLRLFKDSALDYSFQPFDSGLRDTGVPGSHQVSLTYRFGSTSTKHYEVAEISKYPLEPILKPALEAKPWILSRAEAKFFEHTRCGM